MNTRSVLLTFLLAGSLTNISSAQPLKLVEGSEHDVKLRKVDGGVLEIKTTASDPQVVFELAPGASVDEEAYILAFEYFCPDGIDFVEVFYAKNKAASWSQSRQLEGGALPKAEAWQPYAIDLRLRSKGKWTPQDRRIRLDFGRKAGLKIQVRNFHLRAPTKQERVGSEAVQAKLKAKANHARKLNNYLNLDNVPAQIELVAVSRDTVTVSGSINSELKGPFYLVEYTPHEDPWDMNGGTVLGEIELSHTFEAELPRFLDKRDRIANRFAVGASVDGKLQLVSRAIWADDVSDAAEREMPRLYPTNKKGLGGVEYKAGIFKKDITDLGITAATINFPLGSILTPGKDPIEFEHQGKSFAYNRAAIREYDKKLKFLSERNIVASAILLVDKNAGILLHPDYNTAGIYSMGNMTTQASTDAYRAIVAFLAERYSRPDKEHGWISHWIVFNEVDYGWIWTNMGETPMELYMDSYNKAMRLTWLEARRFNPTAEVFISLTHHWQYSPADKYRAYPPRKLLDRMALYSSREGDYQWGVAYHPYPQSLLKPRTWEDSKATASFDTRFITPKNIEVLDAYLHQPQFLHHEKVRTVILSEQGFHTPDYSEASFQDKAAAIAYTWEKILPLDSVESFHYHRWVDHPMEGGLKVGLRTLPEAGHPHGKRKEPAFSVFSALETDTHTDVIEPYKKIIGINEWSEILIPADSIKN